MVTGRAVTVSAVVSGVTTAVFALSHQFRLAYGNPGLRAAFETAATLTAMLAAFLVFGRFRRRRVLGTLLLACALAVIAVSNLLFGFIPVLRGLPVGNFVGWSAIFGGLLGGLLFAAAAFVPDRQLRGTKKTPLLAGSVAVIFALMTIVTWALAAHLPVVVTVAPASRSSPVLHAAPALLVVQMLIAVSTGLAAAGYLARSRRLGDEFSGWLAVAAVFAVASQVNYFLYPSIYAGIVSVGDVFRLCFYAVLLGASMREVRQYWVALADAVVADERSRIAGDLHDGLGQELAYLTRNLSSLEGDIEQETLSRLRGATERARLECRLAISRLAISDQPSIGEAVADAVGEVAKRAGLDLELDLVSGIGLPAVAADALIRIACEAVSNAARHSGASTVAVTLDCADGHVRMLISDRGCGFDTSVRPACWDYVDAPARPVGRGGADHYVRGRPGHPGGGRPVSHGPPIRVLIADDHAPTRADVRRALEGDERFHICSEEANAAGAIQGGAADQAGYLPPGPLDARCWARHGAGDRGPAAGGEAGGADRFRQRQ